MIAEFFSQGKNSSAQDEVFRKISSGVNGKRADRPRPPLSYPVERAGEGTTAGNTVGLRPDLSRSRPELRSRAGLRPGPAQK